MDEATYTDVMMGVAQAFEMVAALVLIAGLVAMVIAIVIGPTFIEWLRRTGVGQQIREEGPEEHHEKAGTPTMGGLIIFTAIQNRIVATFGSWLYCSQNIQRRSSARSNGSASTWAAAW